MDFWLSFLPIIIYLLLIVLLVVGIILGYKTLRTMNKVEKIVDNVNDKVESLNAFFNIIDFTADKLAGFTDKIVDFFTNIIGKLFFKNKKEDKEEEETNE